MLSDELGIAWKYLEYLRYLGKSRDVMGHPGLSRDFLMYV